MTAAIIYRKLVNILTCNCSTVMQGRHITVLNCVNMVCDQYKVGGLVALICP